MFIKDGKRINIDAPFTVDHITYPNLRDADLRAAFGVQEIEEPQAPPDYTEDTYYRTEQDEAPYVVYARKSDDQIKAARAANIQREIDSLEAGSLLPRVTREFMLLQFAAVAAQQGIDPMTNVAYKKVKELDDKIAQLRGQL